MAFNCTGAPITSSPLPTEAMACIRTPPDTAPKACIVASSCALAGWP